MNTKLLLATLMAAISLPACAQGLNRDGYPQLGTPTSSIYLQVQSDKGKPIMGQHPAVIDQRPSGPQPYWKDDNRRDHRYDRDDKFDREDFRDHKKDVLVRLNNVERQIDRMQRCVKHADSYRDLRECRMESIEERWDRRDGRDWRR